MPDSRPNWNSLKESQHPNDVYLRNISQSLDAKCGCWSYFFQCRLESLFNIAWQERSAICPGWMPASLPTLRKCFSSILCAETQLRRMNGSGISRWYLLINLGWAWQTEQERRELLIDGWVQVEQTWAYNLSSRHCRFFVVFCFVFTSMSHVTRHKCKQ